MKSQEWKWGLGIGTVNVVWLFVSWLAGWHGSNIGLFQIAIVLGIFISFAGFVLAFRGITRDEPETTFGEGIGTGAVIAAISGLLTALGWGIYLGWVNTGMSAHLVSQIRDYYLAAGVAVEQVDLIATEAQKSFGTTAYMIKGGVGAFIQGILFSAMVMGWFKWQQRR
jgi:hypothetical protein